MFLYRALPLRCAVTLSRLRQAQLPPVCSSVIIVNRVYLSSTCAAQSNDNGSATAELAASADGDAARTSASVDTAAAIAEPRDKLAPVPVQVKADAHDAQQIDSTAPHSIASNSAMGPQFYTNREGVLSKREIVANSGRNWSDSEILLLQKLYLEEASDLELQAWFPHRNLPAILTRLSLCGPSRRTWLLTDRRLLVSKLAEGYSYDQIRSQWFPSRTLGALRHASDPEKLKRQEARTVSPEVAAELVKLVRAGKTRFEISQALPNVPQLTWHLRKIRASFPNALTLPGRSKQTYQYSDDEWQHVLELHQAGLSVPEIAAAVNRSIPGIQRKLNTHNMLANQSVPLFSRRIWTEAELAVLKPYIHNRVLNLAELSVLNRSTGSIATKLSRLRARDNVTEGLRSRNWTEAEVGLLQSKIDRYHPYKDVRIVDELAKSFGRTRKSLYLKLRALHRQKTES